VLESKHTAKLGKLVRPQIYALKLNLNFQKGVADCYYSGSIMGLWSEHKRFAKTPPVIDLTQISVTTKLQQKFLRDRYDEGRNVSMIVFTDDMGHMLLWGMDWERPIPREEYRTKAVTMKQLSVQLITLVGRI